MRKICTSALLLLSSLTWGQTNFTQGNIVENTTANWKGKKL